MTTQQRLTELIRLIDDAATSPDLWQRFLSQGASLVNTEGFKGIKHSCHCGLS